ncbi:MAG: histidine kinase [Lachnospiraceae bacterium]|nr:histidine kinase [Lachnospiraceae bacterium]
MGKVPGLWNVVPLWWQNTAVSMLILSIFPFQQYFKSQYFGRARILFDAITLFTIVAFTGAGILYQSHIMGIGEILILFWCSYLFTILIDCVLACRRIKDEIPILVKASQLLILIQLPSVLAEIELTRGGRMDLVGWPTRWTLLLYSVITIVFLSKIMIHKMTEEEIRQEMLQKSSNALMLSQVQPHFLFNTMSMLAVLTQADTKKAYSMLIIFSRYLRGNFQTFRNMEWVSFAEERDHAMDYIQLEEMRFIGLIRVEWDVEDSDFNLPPLTIQPLIENAVRHGLCQKTEGGHINIITRENHGYHVVYIEDNGLGFTYTMEQLLELKKSIYFIYYKLKQNRDAEMLVEGIQGKGARVVIRIPV